MQHQRRGTRGQSARASEQAAERGEREERRAENRTEQTGVSEHWCEREVSRGEPTRENEIRIVRELEKGEKREGEREA